MNTIFLSDTHLAPQRPDVTELFLDFLNRHHAGMSTLFILGDLFEAWVGDDAVMPEQQKILDALRILADGGINVFVLHGNRDFLYGNVFETLTGATLLPENSVIDLYGQRVLLAHGDALCTDDVDYQNFRKMVRDPHWQQQALALPVPQRLEMAAKYRTMSKSQSGLKSSDIMDVNADEVRYVMNQYDVQYLIHGHTHRPAIHRLVDTARPTYRIVLGDWLSSASALVCTPETWHLHDSRVPNHNAQLNFPVNIRHDRVS